jgi:uncharacterized protein YkwD
MAGATSGGGLFDQFQQHNLASINQYRATKGLAPLVLDLALSTFALAGSDELSKDYMPHQHFINAANDGSLWASGFRGSAAENQGYANSGGPVESELEQVDDIQLGFFNEGPGDGEAHGHYMNMMNASFTRVGVGLLMVGDRLFLTNDFSE